MKRIHKGMEILIRYTKDLDHAYCNAEHGELFMSGPLPEALNAEDVLILKELRFRYIDKGIWVCYCGE